jgi:hypothetical protein
MATKPSPLFVFDRMMRESGCGDGGLDHARLQNRLPKAILPQLDLLLRPYANHIDGDFLDFRASACVFDFNRQDIIAQEFRR